MPAHPNTYSPVLKTLIAKRLEKEKTVKPKMATSMMAASKPPYIPKGVKPTGKAQQLKSFLQSKPKE